MATLSVTCPARSHRPTARPADPACHPHGYRCDLGSGVACPAETSYVEIPGSRQRTDLRPADCRWTADLDMVTTAEARIRSILATGWQRLTALVAPRQESAGSASDWSRSAATWQWGPPWRRSSPTWRPSDRAAYRWASASTASGGPTVGPGHGRPSHRGLGPTSWLGHNGSVDRADTVHPGRTSWILRRSWQAPLRCSS